MQRVYLDHAATSWPKPKAVIDAVTQAMCAPWSNAGRGTHAFSRAAGRAVYRARQEVASYFGTQTVHDVLFTASATAAVNMVLFGAIAPGDHVLCTMAQHNAVWRPLAVLAAQRAVAVDHVPMPLDGTFEHDVWARMMRPHTKWIVVNHASNVLGTIAPLKDIVAFARAHGVQTIVDAAQTVGHIPIDVATLGVDALAWSGHKALCGPLGTGGVCVAPTLSFSPHIFGGTGTASESEHQPHVRPDGYEAGSANVPAIVGLGTAIRSMRDCDRTRERRCIDEAVRRLNRLAGARVLGPPAGVARVPLVSFVCRDVDSAHIAHELDAKYGIAVRAGLHCAPLAHKQAHTLQGGAVRLSVGVTTTEEELDYALDAIVRIVGGR
ncbi:MAG: aminotransferase class V-fold PLP-dependent enzyme [Paenibacillaceae bacterium]|nr:aminotransferase class V-fold PLP-dependent enzyme [Paenibacillaceae bacterium]